jgi:hypothetical protein
MAIELKPEVIKDIAEWLDAGMLVFIHKTTGEVINYPDNLEDSDLEDMWEDLTSKVEANPDDYLSIEPMHSSEAYKIMEGFILGIDNAGTRNTFSQVIERKKPFRQFNDLLSSYDDLRQQWFAYKAERYMAYVKRQIELDADMDEDDDEDL